MKAYVSNRQEDLVLNLLGTALAIFCNQMIYVYWPYETSKALRPMYDKICRHYSFDAMK